MLNRNEMKALLVSNKEFAKEFNRIVAKVHTLYVTKARATQSTASPETIVACRESVMKLLAGITKNIVALNDAHDKTIMGYVEDLKLVQTKWNLADEFYLIAVEFMEDMEAAEAIAAAHL